MTAASADTERRLFRVGGLWCTSCARAVELVLRRQAGVVGARVSFATGTAVVDVASSGPSLDRLMVPVRKLGYRPAPWDPHPGPWRPDEALSTQLSVRLAVAVLLGMWVMLFQLALYVGEPGPEDARWLASLAGAFSTPVVWVAGARFHRAGFRTLRAGAPGMDFLVSAGSIAAWTVSMASLWAGRVEVWFDTATMLVTLLLAGRAIESRIRARGLQRVETVVRPAVERAVVFRGEDEAECPLESVSVGEVCRVESEHQIPFDGVVEAGHAALDASVLTGESEPVPVGPGDPVQAGAVVMEGSLRLRVTAGVGERRIDAIAARVSEALDQRTELQAVADAFAERLVPGVGVLAGVTGLAVWATTGDPTAATLRAVAVWVVTCPCALGLAVPVAAAVSVAAAARRGIVFRDPDALERAARVEHVVFDKTGTLTAARPQVVQVEPEWAADRVLARAASAEWGIEHPLAATLRHAADRRGLEVDRRGRRRVLPGCGVAWQPPQGPEVRVGSPEWAGADGSVPDDAVAVAEGSTLLGWVRVDAPLLPGAAEVVASLKARGMTVSLWSGDGEARVRAVAAELNISDARGRQGPEDKAEAVRARTAQGVSVAFVGDGINDAPALASADLGVAVSGAAEAALAVSPVVLRRGGVEQVEHLLRGARRARSVMRQNLLWAVVYNATAIPAAIAGVVSPQWAAAAMVLSSLTVSANAVRLQDSGTRRGRALEGVSVPRSPA